MVGRIVALYAKPARGAAMQPVDTLRATTDGLVGDASDPSPLRHLLLLPTTTLSDFALAPDALRANVIVDTGEHDALHPLVSGTVLAIGGALVRLTVHCEPCARTRPYAPSNLLQHRRGYLAQVLRGGVLRVGDGVAVDVSSRRCDPIPYAVKDRVAWYLAQCERPIAASALLRAIGVHRSYARALPRLLASLPAPLRDKVEFAGKPRMTPVDSAS